MAATTATDVRALIIGWVNADRAAVGLVPWRGWGVLNDLATERAQRTADTHTLSHAAAGGNVGDALNAASIPWSWYGEALGMTGASLSEAGARQIFDAWIASDPHRAILRSDVNNYVGVGVARADDGSTWVSLIATQSPDHTAPVASTVSVTRSGRTLTYAWSGADPKLQSLTAGVRSFDLQYRRDDRPWSTVRNDTSSTSYSRTVVSGGHWYLFRVQATDRRGTLSAWTRPMRIWVP